MSGFWLVELFDKLCPIAPYLIAHPTGVGSMLRSVLATFIFFSFQVSANEFCNKPEGIESLTANQNVRYIIFGELHGNKETPNLFSESVCTLAASGKKVVVGIEHSKLTKDAYLTFMESEGTKEDEEHFLKGSDFATPFERAFGLTSEAMFDMIKKMRLFKQSGLDITVVPFVSYSGSVSGLSKSQTPYEKELAANLIEYREQYAADILMVLVGNIHAMKSQARGLPFEPMAMHFPSDSTLSINLVYTGGDSWYCSKECGIQEVKSSSDDSNVGFKISGEPLVSDDEEKLSSGYSGVFNLGEITASPPVSLSK